ncbi:hypothetical protein [Pseudodesulfovibrio methanolicus]|uniref:Uncharacterized protein n=1 Tax=Pseudodesulfovibrio methanolicus TaxID=3126690 RepID=A0ABZ2J4L4_9BACT
MQLFGIDLSSQEKTGLSMSIGGQRASSEAPPSAPIPDAAYTQKALAADNTMTGHFVHAGRKQSKYITGLMMGFELEKTFSNQMRSVVAGYNNLVDLTAKAKALAGDKINNIDRERIGEEAADHVKTVIDNEVSDTNNEKLEDIREEIEEKADEAVKPESEKALENTTAPREELEKSLDGKTQADPTGATPSGEKKTVTASDQSADAGSQPPYNPADSMLPESIPAAIDILV